MRSEAMRTFALGVDYRVSILERVTMKEMIYVASPYSHHDPVIQQARYERVVEYCARCMAKGEHVFSPIAACHPMTTTGKKLPGDFRYWRSYDLRILRMCDSMRVLALDGWMDSIGVTAEIQAAKAMGMVVVIVGRMEEAIEDAMRLRAKLDGV